MDTTVDTVYICTIKGGKGRYRYFNKEYGLVRECDANEFDSVEELEKVVKACGHLIDEVFYIKTEEGRYNYRKHRRISLGDSLQKIAHYEDNWDGYGGIAPCLLTIQRMNALLHLWRSEYPTEITVAGDGEISFDWRRGSLLISIIMDNDTETYSVFVSKDSAVLLMEDDNKFDLGWTMDFENKWKKYYYEVV